MSYVDVATLSVAASVSRQAIEKVLKRIEDGFSDTWHGCALETRKVHGRGGRSGIQYQVKVASLPSHIQERLKALEIADNVVSKYRLGDDTARRERAWKYEQIKAAIAHPKGSADRKAEIDRLAGVSVLDWNGHYRTVTRSTLYKWIDIHDREGIYGLSQKVRSDKGLKKVIISRAWSEAVPFSENDKETIAEEIRQFVRGSIAKGSKGKLLQVVASKELRRLSNAWGFNVLDDATAEKVFRVPQELIAAEVSFKAVYRHNFDRKASEDNKPRIQRTIAGLVPMEIVVMDVHHINVMVRRENGTLASPKLLAFHDVATNRVFCEIVFFEERGGVRNVHVIEAFKRMCQHPAFGMPQKLYADNGSEYGFVDYLEDALKLNCKVLDKALEDERSIIRANPYNAAAKVVEGFFRQLNQQFMRLIPGFIDDDRMKPKRKELGKPMPPYNGSLDDFFNVVFKLLAAYEAIGQGGALEGKSPSQAFKQHVDAGWAATVVDDRQFYMAFSKPEGRKLDKHAVRYDGRLWTCSELDRCFEPKVVVMAPAYHGFNELRVETVGGELIGWAKPDQIFSYLDPTGAVHSATRVKDRNAGLREKEKSVPNIDLLAKVIDIGESEPAVIPNPPSSVISVDFDASEGRAIVPSNSPKIARQQREAEQERLREARRLMINTAISGKGL